MKNKGRDISTGGRRCRETILVVEGIGKNFVLGNQSLTVLEDIDFLGKKGEMICILGPSGCGKSTLLNILAGFLPPTGGSVCIDGIPIQKPGPDRCVVFQEDALFPWLTVRENIAFGLRYRKKTAKALEKKVDRFLSLVGLHEFGDYLPGEISGGMKQRVALARVLIIQPRVLLMDEPFAALDAQSREEMQNLLLSLWAQFSHTILFVTHDVNEAVKLADRILLMDKGPGQIHETIDIDLARPRQSDSTEFVQIRRRIHKILRS
jgi:ABC-type nitrate/sulfonate/bicarbonate transport system ATPase subunit